jgi:hypothetical protein
MIKFTTTVDYKTGETKEFVVGVNTTLYAQWETVQIMSDVWEQIYTIYYWNDETNTLSSRHSDSTTVCTFDADYESIFVKFEQNAFKRNFGSTLAKAESDSNIVAVKNRVVKVVKGKTSVGLEGKVVAMTQKYYGNHYNAPLRYKVAIALDDEMTTFTAKNGKQYPCHKNVVWVWDLNCEVVNPVVDHNEVNHIARSKTTLDMDVFKAKCKQNMKVAA